MNRRGIAGEFAACPEFDLAYARAAKLHTDIARVRGNAEDPAHGPTQRATGRDCRLQERRSNGCKNLAHHDNERHLALPETPACITSMSKDASTAAAMLNRVQGGSAGVGAPPAPPPSPPPRNHGAGTGRSMRGASLAGKVA